MRTKTAFESLPSDFNDNHRLHDMEIHSYDTLYGTGAALWSLFGPLQIIRNEL